MQGARKVTVRVCTEGLLDFSEGATPPLALGLATGIPRMLARLGHFLRFPTMIPFRLEPNVEVRHRDPPTAQIDPEADVSLLGVCVRHSELVR